MMKFVLQNTCYKSFLIAAVILFFSIGVVAQQSALNFDGIDDMVPSSTMINIAGAAERTVEAWIQTTDSGAQHIVGWGVLETGKRFDIRLQDSYLRLETENGPIIGLNTILNDGEWHHIAVVLPPGVETVGGVIMYVDGNIEPHTTHFRLIETVNSPITIGSNPYYPGREFHGIIDELRIWNVARSQEEIIQYMSYELCDTSGLAARYSFNEGVPNGINTTITTTLDEISGEGSELIDFAMTGTTSNFVDGKIFQGITGVDVQTSCGPYTWINGETYDTDNNSATFVIVGGAANTCDSTVTLDLTMFNTNVTSTDPSITADFPGATYQWLDCDDNMSEIPNENGQSFSASENGNYAVIVTYESCTDTSACVSITAVSVEDINIFEATTIYPNPNHGQVNIKLGDLDNVDISIVDITGKSVFEVKNIRTKNYKFNLDVPSGMYLVELQSEGEYKNFRLVIQK